MFQVIIRPRAHWDAGDPAQSIAGNCIHNNAYWRIVQHRTGAEVGQPEQRSLSNVDSCAQCGTVTLQVPFSVVKTLSLEELIGNCKLSPPSRATNWLFNVCTMPVLCCAGQPASALPCVSICARHNISFYKLKPKFVLCLLFNYI